MCMIVCSHQLNTALMLPSVLWRCCLGSRKGTRPVKTDAGMVICLGQGADLHVAQLMPLPLTISCSSKSRLVLPFWYRLTQVVLDRIQEGRKMAVCVTLIAGRFGSGRGGASSGRWELQRRHGVNGDGYGCRWSSWWSSGRYPGDGCRIWRVVLWLSFACHVVCPDVVVVIHFGGC